MSTSRSCPSTQRTYTHSTSCPHHRRGGCQPWRTIRLVHQTPNVWPDCLDHSSDRFLRFMGLCPGRTRGRGACPTDDRDRSTILAIGSRIVVIAMASLRLDSLFQSAWSPVLLRPALGTWVRSEVSWIGPCWSRRSLDSPSSPSATCPMRSGSRSQFGAESLARLLETQAKGQRYLLVQGNQSQPLLKERLQASGGEIDVATVYENRDVASVAPAVRQRLLDGDIDFITVRAVRSLACWSPTLVKH